VLSTVFILFFIFSWQLLIRKHIFFPGPNGQSIPALVKDTADQTFRVEFCPKFVGEHKISVNYKKVPMAGSPFSSKVYDVNAIKVKPSSNGTLGQPVTFISKIYIIQMSLLVSKWDICNFTELRYYQNTTLTQAMNIKLSFLSSYVQKSAQYILPQNLTLLKFSTSSPYGRTEVRHSEGVLKSKQRKKIFPLESSKIYQW